MVCKLSWWCWKTHQPIRTNLIIIISNIVDRSQQQSMTGANHQPSQVSRQLLPPPAVCLSDRSKNTVDINIIAKAFTIFDVVVFKTDTFTSVLCTLHNVWLVGDCCFSVDFVHLTVNDELTDEVGNSVKEKIKFYKIKVDKSSCSLAFIGFSKFVSRFIGN